MDFCDQCGNVIALHVKSVYLPKTGKTFCSPCYDGLRARMLGYMLDELHMEFEPAKHLLDSLPRAS